MYFNQFSRKLSEQITGVAVARQLHSNGYLIEMTVNQVVTIDGKESTFSTITEARNFIKKQYQADKLEQEIAKEIYEEISDSKIANIIAEHHAIKVTDTIIESYVELASSKVFTLDPVVEEIRNLNKLDNFIKGKMDFILDDGSVIAINENTFTVINNILAEQTDIIDYMRESKQNFISVIEQLEG